MKKIINVVKRIMDRDDFCFVVVGVLYFIMFVYTPEINDDQVLRIRYTGIGLRDHWNLIVDDYSTWSSRVLVDFAFRVMLQLDIYVWLIINSLMVVVLLKSLSKLFIKNNTRECNVMISFLFMLLPIYVFGTAGWVTTTVTYFWTVAVGFLSLVPIRKIMDSEEFRWWEYIIYSAGLIYAANEEMELVVILFCYVTALMCFIIMKKKLKYIILQNILSIGSLVFTFTAPGNQNRSELETVNWFKDYGMLNIIDKVDLGFTSTLEKVMTANYLFILLVCFLLAASVWNQYRDSICRCVASIPVVFLAVFGFGKDMSGSFYDKLIDVSDSVTEHGLVTVENYYQFHTFVSFFVLCTFAVCFIMAMYLALKTTYQFLVGLILLAAGMASRMAMGFSPTIWGSGDRTYVVLFFSLMVVGIITYENVVRERIINQVKRKKFLDIVALFAMLAYLNNCIVVMG